MRYKTKNKIKYFFRRNLKRLIRAFVLFGLISILSIVCFAQEEYQYTYSQLVSNGWSDVYIKTEDNNEELFYTTVDSSAHDFEVRSQWAFDGVRVNINRSNFLNRSFNVGYVWFFNGTIRIDVNTGYQINFIDYCSINLNYVDNNGNSKSILFDNNYFELLKQTSFDWGTQYYIKFDINNYSFTDNGTITSLDFNFDKISARTFGCVLQFHTNTIPDIGTSPFYTFYLGTKEDAPTFLPPNNDAFNDFSSAEEELLNNTNADDEINSIFNGFSSVIGDYANGFTILREFLNPFLEWSPFLNILFISLALGIFGLLVNMGFSAMSASDRKSRNEYYKAQRDYFKSRKKG